MAAKEVRSNMFEVILYPESLPDDFIQVLEDIRVPCLLSPCHNADRYNDYDQRQAELEIEALNTLNVEYKDGIIKPYLKDVKLKQREIERLQHIKSGNTKKEHYHLLINYGAGANKTREQVVKDFCEPLNALRRVRVVNSERGYARYLIHQDHPDKAQYRFDELRILNGYQIKDFYEYSSSEEKNSINKVLNIIDEYGIQSYKDLVNLCRVDARIIKYVKNNSLFLDKYLNAHTELIGDRLAELQQELLNSMD